MPFNQNIVDESKMAVNGFALFVDKYSNGTIIRAINANNTKYMLLYHVERGVVTQSNMSAKNTEYVVSIIKRGLPLLLGD